MTALGIVFDAELKMRGKKKNGETTVWMSSCLTDHTAAS
jgi:hypothetical protein